MIDVMKRLADLDTANPSRPEHKVSGNQNITALSESAQVDECGMMPGMGDMGRPSTPASINMTAGSGDELGELIKAIATLAGQSRPAEMEPLSAMPTMGVASNDGMDMRAMIDKLNPMDDEGDEELKKVDEYDNTPADPTDTNEFDAEQHAHHENPPGAARSRGNMNNPRANTMEQIEQNLFAEYQKFISESEQLAAVKKNPRSVDVQAVYKIISRFDQNMSEIYAYGDPDYKAAIAALQQGDVETAVGAVVDTYGNQNGGEIRNMDVYAKDLQDEFEYIVQGGDGDKGVAEGSDDLIRSAVLSVLQDIYNGAQAGEDMIDTVADELGDYFQDVKRSKDKTLRKAYQFMRREGAEAEDDPEMMAQVANKAINMLSQQGVAEGGVSMPGGQYLSIPADQTKLSIGQQMARDGITYSPDKEDELIGLISQYMKKAGMSSKQIRYLLNYDEDYISDQLSDLPKKGTEEGIEDRLKDLDLKNPVNIPAYQRKAASGDSASAARNTKESANESMTDILKLSGLK